MYKKKWEKGKQHFNETLKEFKKAEVRKTLPQWGILAELLRMLFFRTREKLLFVLTGTKIRSLCTTTPYQGQGLIKSFVLTTILGRCS